MRVTATGRRDGGDAAGEAVQAAAVRAVVVADRTAGVAATTIDPGATTEPIPASQSTEPRLPDGAGLFYLWIELSNKNQHSIRPWTYSALKDADRSPVR